MRERHDTPRARQQNLVVKAVGDEVLVYDVARHRAHSLNRVAAAVWRCCDGHRTLMDIAARASAEIGHPLDLAVVEYALAQLARAHLLAAGPVLVSEGPQLGRRDVLRRVAVAAMLPVVVSVLAPTPAAAQSCTAEGDPCFALKPDCCPGFGCCVELGNIEGTGVCCPA